MGVRGREFRVVGYVSSAFGLGIAAANTVSVLQGAGLPVSVVDVDPGGGRQGRDSAFAELERELPARRAVNVFHMNPPEILEFQNQWTDAISLRSGVNVCVPFWELPQLPESWVPILDGMDVVLAPTRFIAEACEAALSRPVVHYPQAVIVPADVAADRERWGIPPGTTAYLISYDAESDTARKNPLAALAAFEQAFADTNDVFLLVKLNRSELSEVQRQQVESVRERVSALRNARIIEGNLPYRDVLSLYASCDVLVSLHRAEGLGLHLMEAMSLGRVVVATGWSGNTDFMTAENSFAVPYELVPIESTNAAYGPEVGRAGQRWAEADVDAAACILQLTHDRPELRAQVGRQAALDMATRRANVALAEPLRGLAGASHGPRASARERALLRELLEAKRRSQPGAAGALSYRWARLKRRAVLELRARGMYRSGG